MKYFSQKQFIAPLIYFMLVSLCVLMAFDYNGSLNSGWWLFLCGLTLPWSIISFFFIWALIHGAGLEFFTILYLFFASVNAYFLYKIFLPKGLLNKELSIKG